jgi:LPPG:FO 2-phospho-L-lactate transferase
MTDSPVHTIVNSDEGELAFQEYFVHRQCGPKVKGFRFDGVDVAEPAFGVREAVESAEAIVICPSNPWVSVDPILRVIPLPKKKIVAVSPIIGGKTVKGPAAKMYAELGIEPSALAVAEHYRDLLSGFVLDNVDAHLSDKIRTRTLVTDTLMNSLTDRARLAMDVLNFIGSL